MGRLMRKNKLLPILLAACFLRLFVCLPAWTQSNTGATEMPVPVQSQIPVPVQSQTFPISPGDVISVQIFDTPELSSDSVGVSKAGDVNLPVAGLIKVSGLNANQAARKIEQELRARGIMVDPHVTVSVVAYASPNATVLGEVRSPGIYPVLGGRRLLDVIAMAGGLAPTAGKIVTIVRHDDPHHPITVKLVSNAQALGAQANPVIFPDDIVDFGRAGIVYILGAVGKPGGYLVDSNEHMSLMQVLSLAGGWQKEASLSRVHLIRKVPQGHKEITLDLKHVLESKQADIYLKNGDILFVPTSLGKTLGYAAMQSAVTAAETAAVYSTLNSNN